MLKRLTDMWQNAIRGDVEAGRVATERELQACVYFHLRQRGEPPCRATDRVR